MSTPQRMIVATFNATGKAEHQLHTLEALGKHLHGFPLGDIAVLEKTQDGTLRMHETRDPLLAFRRIADTIAGTSATVAGAAAWLVYAFFGLPGPQAGQAAFAGTTEAIMGVVKDVGFDDDQLRDLADGLDAGSSALILVVPEAAAPAVADQLQRLGGMVVTRPIPTGFLQSGPDC